MNSMQELYKGALMKELYAKAPWRNSNTGLIILGDGTWRGGSGRQIHSRAGNLAGGFTNLTRRLLELIRTQRKNLWSRRLWSVI